LTVQKTRADVSVLEVGAVRRGDRVERLGCPRGDRFPVVHARLTLNLAVALEVAGGAADFDGPFHWPGRAGGGAGDFHWAEHAEDDRFAAPVVDRVAEERRRASNERRDNLRLKTAARRRTRPALHGEHRERA